MIQLFINKAQAAFYVNSADVLNAGSDKAMLDKLNQPILVLQDNVILMENIEYFCCWE